MFQEIPFVSRPWQASEIWIEGYAKDGGPGKVWFLCSFYHESLRTWIKTIVNKFAISNHTALILRVHALRSYLKLICEYERHNLPNKNVSGAKDHGKNCIKVKPPLVRHLLHKHPFIVLVWLSRIQFMKSMEKRLFSARGRCYGRGHALGRSLRESIITEVVLNGSGMASG